MKVKNKCPEVYDYPEIYDKLFRPEDSQIEWLNKYLAIHFQNGVETLLEPACGPGYWLNHIKAQKCVGIDINEKMISWCKERFEGDPRVSVMLGDMRSLPKEFSSKFDLAVNLESTIGHLGSENELLSHFLSIRKSLLLGGLYFFACPFENDLTNDLILSERWESNWEPLFHGIAKLEMWYEYPNNNLSKPITNYKISIKDNKLYPRYLSGNFEIKRYDHNLIGCILQKVGFELITVNYMELPNAPESPNLYNLGSSSVVVRAV